MACFKCSLLLIFFVFLTETNGNDINLGLLYEDNNPLVEKVFQRAIELANSELLQNTFPISGVSAEIPYGNAYESSKKLCKMLRSGVAAIFGPTSAGSSVHAMSICDAKEVPFIDTRWDADTQLPTINIHPYPRTLILVVRDLIKSFDWNGFTILYEAGPYLPVLDELLQMYGKGSHTITVKRYDLHLHGNYRNVLRKIKKSEDVRIVIIGSIDTLAELLQQAQQVGLMTEEYQYIVANLDLHTIDLEPYRYSETNVTGIRLFDPDDPRVQALTQHLTDQQDGGGSDAQNESNDAPQAVSDITLHMALIYDGVNLLTQTLHQVNSSQLFDPIALNCRDSGTWETGFTLVNFMKTSSFNGITGEIKFDHQGLRTDFVLDIIELTAAGIVKTGAWSQQSGLHMQREQQTSMIEKDERSLRNKTFIVITAITPPYGMLKETSQKLIGNEQYEGFGIELIHELSTMLGFNYTFRIEEDKVYGSYNKETKSWNGMIREILEGVSFDGYFRQGPSFLIVDQKKQRADLAITDLTMTSDRESAVDFTMPFMNLGISILYRKPIKEPPKLFSFMSPFSKDVWLYLGAAYLSVSLSLFILGRLSPAEWDNPYPCVEEPTVLENQFSFSNSLWFTVGALLQQGSEIAPKASATRTVASTWWFFTIIMVSSYTANLAAFLTVESLSTPISSAEDLANGNGGVTYGAKRDGSTFNFFKDAKYETYQRMHEYMAAHPESLTSSNEEGVFKAETENYAFLMESTSIEYNVERRCNLTQIGGLLDEKGYGIAMLKNSPYRNALSQAILSLQEQGKLSKMKTKWWKEKRGGGACADSGGDSGALALEVANLGGVFLLLILGTLFAALFSVLEMILDVRRRAIDNEVPFKEELMDELRFVIKCSGNTKEVKHRKSSSQGSHKSSLTIESLGMESNERINIDGKVEDKD